MQIELDVDWLLARKHSPIRNYAIPGLTSWLIGPKPGIGSPHGCMRLFEMEREPIFPITPHSHRFDLQCVVLAGEVRNRTWRKKLTAGEDLYHQSILKYGGQPGNYRSYSMENPVQPWGFIEDVFKEGENYSMLHSEVHSIYFSKGSKVLFIEGRSKTSETTILEPYAGDKTVQTLKVEPWMFLQEITA